MWQENIVFKIRSMIDFSQRTFFQIKKALTLIEHFYPQRFKLT